jgi:hypothetical protein
MGLPLPARELHTGWAAEECKKDIFFPPATQRPERLRGPPTLLANFPESKAAGALN